MWAAQTLPGKTRKAVESEAVLGSAMSRTLRETGTWVESPVALTVTDPC